MITTGVIVFGCVVGAADVLFCGLLIYLHS
jgi:hypothetical protein